MDRLIKHFFIWSYVYLFGYFFMHLCNLDYEKAGKLVWWLWIWWLHASIVDRGDCPSRVIVQRLYIDQLTSILSKLYLVDCLMLWPRKSIDQNDVGLDWNHIFLMFYLRWIQVFSLVGTFIVHSTTCSYQINWKYYIDTINAFFNLSLQ